MREPRLDPPDDDMEYTILTSPAYFGRAPYTAGAVRAVIERRLEKAGHCAVNVQIDPDGRGGLLESTPQPDWPERGQPAYDLADMYDEICEDLGHIWHDDTCDDPGLVWDRGELGDERLDSLHDIIRALRGGAIIDCDDLEQREIAEGIERGIAAGLY